MGLGIIMGNTRGYRYKDETGNRYGKLTYLSFVRTNKLTSFGNVSVIVVNQL